jgi:hypothetical protein
MMEPPTPSTAARQPSHSDTLGRVTAPKAHREAEHHASLLPAVLAALFLSFVTIPVVSSRLDSLWSSQFMLGRIDVSSPACVPPGICLRYFVSKVERTTSGYELPIVIEGVDNVYHIAKDLDEGRLGLVLPEGADRAQRPSIRPHYDFYFASDEVVRQLPASLQFPGPPPARVTFALESAGAVSEYRTLDFIRRDVGQLGSLLLEGGTSSPWRLGMGLLLLLMTLVTHLADFRAASALGNGAFAYMVVARWAAIAATAWISSFAFSLLVILAILLPWLAFAVRLRSRTLIGMARGPLKWLPSLWKPIESAGGVSATELVMLTVAIGVFASLLWSGSSFRWGIFEERDFLEARHVLSNFTFPIYGPELLMGGHTIGGSLYMILSPVVALWNDPAVLLLLNRLLFLGMALVLWWGVRHFGGPGGALFAVWALVASERLLALSYWPIHPNFSLFFAFLYACALLRGAVDGHKGWLIFSGLLLGVLPQLHFSYLLFLPCHILLVLVANYDRDRWTKPAALAAFLLPLGPFLLVDVIRGLPNIAQIAERPRFHHLYPNRPFGNTNLPALVFGWVKGIDGALTHVVSALAKLAIALGLAAGFSSTAASARRAQLTPALAAAALFSVPAFELTVLGMGYNTRHTLTVVPGLFIMAGLGFVGVVSAIAPTKRWIGTCLIVPLLTIIGIQASHSAAIEKISKSEGEWAIDYHSRQAIGRDLAVRLGVTPQTYAHRAYWWWVGWSIDADIYSDIYRRSVSYDMAETSSLAPGRYVLVTSAAELPPFLGRLFVSEGSRPVTEMHVHVARPRDHFAAPSSNVDTGVRLHPFLEAVDQLRGRSQDFARIGHAQVGAARRDLFFGRMAEGRIKVLIATEQALIHGRNTLRWCVDSPTLGGHYQEIKTVWRPRLLLVPGNGVFAETSLANDVLGSLPYKTPRCGEASTDQTAPWQVALAVDGVFDQSFMSRPDLSQRRWQLDFAAPIRNDSLSPQAIQSWIETRFNR